MWNDCLKRLESDISPDEIATWIEPLDVKIEPSKISLYVTNDLILSQVSSYLKLIESAVKEYFGDDYQVFLSLKNQKENKKIKKITTKKTKNNFKSNIDKRFTFDSFVKGRSNEIAFAAAQQAAQQDDNPFNPLFFYGTTGLGKTHLLHSIGNYIIKNNPEKMVYYVHSESYVNEMITALRNNSIDQFKEKYRSVNILLIDDIQFFAGKERSQEEFFHTFNHLFKTGNQIVITSDRFPKEINGLEQRLKSRLGSGLSIAIDPPDYETRVAILQDKAKLMNLEVDNDVIKYIAKQINSNVRELEGALNTLYANAQFTGVKIDLNYTKNALKQLFNVHHRVISIENIQKTTAEYYNIKLSELLGKSRKRSIVRPRQMAMYLAKEMTDKSYPEVGEFFGGRDHTTVLHAYRKIEELLKQSPPTNEDKQKIVNKLTE